MNSVRSRKLKTARCWCLQEMLRDLWICPNRTPAEALFRSWYNWAIRCCLNPVKRVSRMLKNHLPAVLNYFTHCVTAAVSEGINNAIGRCVHKAYGYRNRERFKTDILFHLGGLNMHLRFAQ